MRLRPERLDWKLVAWWLPVLLVALAIKHHYSVATAAELQWMLKPLSQVLEWASGHLFQRDHLHEWVSESADVRLVKGCAGINFLVMSLLAWAWVFRPADYTDAGAPAWVARKLLLLLTLIMAAWATALLANSLRILIAMHLPYHGDGLHRLIGMLVYVPLLSLQLHLGDRNNWQAALAGPVVLYLLLMVVVPLLTGNAFNSPERFVQHLLYLVAMVTVFGGIYVWTRIRPHRSRLAPLGDTLRERRCRMARLHARFVPPNSRVVPRPKIATTLNHREPCNPRRHRPAHSPFESSQY